jgi:PAS domain S-box-containing protein
MYIHSNLRAATPRFSEAGYRALFEHHNIVMMIMDAETGAIVDANQAALRFYGYSYSQLTSMNIKQINTLPPGEIADVRYQVMDEKQTTFHFKHRLADGTLRDVEVHSSHIVHDGCNFICSIIQNITDQKKTQEALRLLVNSTDDLIFTLDCDQTYTGIYGQWAALSESWLHKTPIQIFGEHESKIHIQANQKALLGENVIYEWQTDYAYFQTSISPLYNAYADIIGLVGVARNITSQKLTEQSLRASEQFAISTSSHLFLLNRIMSCINSTLDTNVILDVACLELGNLLEMPHILATVLDEQQTTFTVVAEYMRSDQPAYVGKKFLVHDHKVLNYFTQYRAPLWSKDLPTNPDLDSLRVWLCENNVDSLLLAPLIIKDQLAGFIAVEGSNVHTFSEEDITLLFSTTRAISQALENSYLHREIADYSQKLEEIIEERTRQLTRLNERMAAILNSAADAILLLREDGSIDNTNPAFCRMFGYAPDELFGQSVQVLAEREDTQPFETRLQQTMDGGEPKNLQITVRRKDGTTFDADISLARINGSSRTTYILCSIRDITELKEVERIKDKFISTVSHELRTPITSIMLSVNNMKNYYHRMTDDQRIAMIGRLDTQSNVLAEMVEGILDISRIEARQSVRTDTPCDLAALTRKVVSELQTDLRSKNLQLDFDFHPGSKIVYGEAIDFSRIWRNLISNAIKYTLENHQIWVRIGYVTIHPDGTCTATPNLSAFTPPANLAAGTYVTGQVEDSGRGIPPDQMKSLFTRFYRGWAGQSNIPGTGLGLALVRELLSLYNGAIGADSQLGVGSCFTFYLTQHDVSYPHIKRKSS